MKRHSPKLNSGFIKLRRNLFKAAILATIIFIAGFFAIMYSKPILVKLDNFKIKDIIVKDNLPMDFSYYKGKSILALDLKKESSHLSDLYPQYKKFRLIRI